MLILSDRSGKAGYELEDINIVLLLFFNTYMSRVSQLLSYMHNKACNKYCKFLD